MKIANWLTLALLAGAVAAAPAAAEQTNYDIGKVGGSELKIPLGARAIGMGEAFVGLADDINATAWNPAGLAQLSQHNLGFMHSFYLQDVSLEYIAYAMNLFEGAGLGVNFGILNFGTLEKVEDVGGTPVITGEFTPMVFMGSAGYGQWFVPGVLAAGGSLKFIAQNIDSTSYSAVAVDLGALLRPGVEGLQLGLSIQNLGTSLGDATLPMNAKVGGAYALPAFESKDTWTALLDVNLPFGDVNYTSVNLGTEYVFNSMAAVRLGYKIKDAGDLGGVTGLTAGAGLMLDMFKLDYALASYGDLGLTHYIMAAVTF